MRQKHPFKDVWRALAATVPTWNILLRACLIPLAEDLFLNSTFLPECLLERFSPEVPRTGDGRSNLPFSFLSLFWRGAGLDILPEPAPLFLG